VEGGGKVNAMKRWILALLVATPVVFLAFIWPGLVITAVGLFLYALLIAELAYRRN